MGACWPLGPADVITSTHRGHGHCLAKGLEPLGHVRRAHGQGRGHQPRPGRLDAHRRPEHRHLRRQRDRGRRCAHRRWRGDRGPAPRRRWTGRGLLRRRRTRPGRVPRGPEPGRGVAAPGGLLLREQRVRRVLPRLRPSTAPPSSVGPPGTASPTSPSTATTSWRRRTSWRRSRHRAGRGRTRRGGGDDVPVARPLRGRPRALPERRGGRGVEGARPAPRARGPTARIRRGRRRTEGAAVVGGRASSTPPSRRPGAWRPRTRPPSPTSSCGRDRRTTNRRAPPRTRRCSA